MNHHSITQLLEGVRAGRVSVEEGRERLATLPWLDLGHSRVDTHRELRCGAAEVVFGIGKTPGELVDVARAIVARHGRCLVTRATPEGAAALAGELEGAVVHERARAVTFGLPPEGTGEGEVLVVSAGTSDGAVAEEAVLTARMLGARVESLADVGVAGIHRLLAHSDELRRARVVVCVAGMEGALPSVVGGLVERPVIAVPTSIGYGAHFGGLAALLAMLNSCAAGITVVNVDNGFGGGYAAALINRLPQDPRPATPEA